MLLLSAWYHDRVRFLLVTVLVVVLTITHCSSFQQDDDGTADLLSEEQSTRNRQLVALGAKPNHPTSYSKTQHRRRVFPETNPHVCLAFLSCCDRIDLLNHTLAGAIRHLEEDEPSFLRYEIAWVDNGSDPALLPSIQDSFSIEHVLTLPQNMGLAYGMNLLISQLCTAPYILLLEEDWLYLDELVAPPTSQRKHSIASAIALTEHLSSHNVTAYDGHRLVMGVFLRHESYETFLRFPLADNWETASQVDIQAELPRTTTSDALETNDACEATIAEVDQPPLLVADIDYRIFCSDPSMHNEAVWGSYTNGAGLYRRSDLHSIGRMYGEPGDAFHDRYVESNYAFRAGMNHCHAALRLTDDRTCNVIHHPNCAGSFHHIGGGRGTRPMNSQGTTCIDPSWSFVGTPLYSKYKRYVEQNTGQPLSMCSKEELQELRDRKFRDEDSKEYRRLTKESNEEVFRKEQAQREKIREEANVILEMLMKDPVQLKSSAEWMEGMTDDEIRETMEKMKRLSYSPHPMEGFWDLHGRIN